MRLPRIAYILLWFPKPSETFIFREVVNLQRLGLHVKVFTLYGPLSWKLSSEMLTYRDVEHLGLSALKRLPGDLAYWWRKNPALVWELFRTVPVRRWKSLEFGGENIIAFLYAFILSRMFEKEGFDHIHAPWAMGPATAAWIASRLTSIPFSFTGRAHDIHPPDGALKEKVRDCTFVRVNSKANVDYMKGFAGGHGEKIHLTYNGYPLVKFRTAPLYMKPPYQILALGRFHPIKGFDILLRAARILKDQGIDFHLTIVGAGFSGIRLKFLRAMLGLSERVSFPGFVSYDRVSDYFSAADIFVIPSIVLRNGEYENLPNVIMEALLHRVPIVATSVGSIPEVIRNNETGLLAAEKDPRALAASIRKMLSSRQAALEMAEKGRELVLRVFDPIANHGRVFDLFLEKCRPMAQQ